MSARALIMVCGLTVCVYPLGQLTARDPGITEQHPDETLRLSASATQTDSIVDPVINWPVVIGIQQTATVNAGFSSFGTFGVYYAPVEVPEWSYAAFRSPPNSDLEYLWGAGIWVGGIIGEDTLVSTSTGIDFVGRELHPPGFGPGSGRGSITRIGGPADYAMRAVFTDTIHDGIYYPPDPLNSRPYLPLNVRIVNRSHVWRTSPYEDAVVYDLIITNMGDEVISQGYVGFYFDCDIGGVLTQRHIDDLVGSLRDYGIGYMYDNDGNPVNQQLPDSASPRRALSLKFLAASFDATDTCFNWWRSNLNRRYDYGPRRRETPEEPFRDFLSGGLGSPGCDADCYYLLSGGEWDYDQFRSQLIEPNDPIWLPPPSDLVLDMSNGADSRFLMSIGPFDLLPDSSVRLLYATYAPDSIIYRPDMLRILDLLPEYYAQALDRDKIVQYGYMCDTLAHLLMDPGNPVTGLRITGDSLNWVEIAWDPWVFNSVDGYEIYLSSIPPESVPHPGVIPVWYRPSEPTHLISTGSEARYRIESLSRSNLYCINVAHRSDGAEGDIGEPIVFRLGGRAAAPNVASDYAFISEGSPARIAWSEPVGADVHHYNIYRFQDTSEAGRRFHAFYDRGIMREIITPADSFDTDEGMYYYYTPNVHCQVSAVQHEFTDYAAEDGVVYVIAAVDSSGFESEFSYEILTQEIYPRTKEILVLTCSADIDNFVEYDTIRTFYEQLLQGYVYDIYNYRDTLIVINCQSQDPSCLDWRDFTRYRMLIIDDGLRDMVVNNVWESRTDGLTKYAMSGGKVAYFGSLTHFNGFTMDTPAGWYTTTNPYVRRLFAIDSAYFVGVGHFRTNETPPYIDTSLGFALAEGSDDSVPDLSFDTLRHPFTSDLEIFWPPSTPPSVSAFAPTDSGKVTHLFRSRYPGSSRVEQRPVGVASSNGLTETYLFGFHLWYMNAADARSLIEWLDSSGGISSCCAGAMGNVDGSFDDRPDISDLMMLLRYLYYDEGQLTCPEEGNIDGSLNGTTDIGDLTALISYLFMGGMAPAPCR